MKTRLLWPFALGFALLVVVLDATIYSVKPGQQAIITRFGRATAGRIGPGIHIKAPFADEVHVFDARLMSLRVEPQAVLTVNQKRLFVDAFIEWRIHSFRTYLASTDGVQHRADEQLRRITNSAIHHVFETQDLKAAISQDGNSQLRQSLNKEANRYGITVVDMRVQRIGFSDRVADAIEKRMVTSQMRRAAKLEAEGMAAAELVRGSANRKRADILARAYEKAQKIRGQGDADAGAIYAKAYKYAPHFFIFYKTLRAYVKSFANRHTVLVLGPRSGFLQFLPHSGGRK